MGAITAAASPNFSHPISQQQLFKMTTLLENIVCLNVIPVSLYNYNKIRIAGGNGAATEKSRNNIILALIDDADPFKNLCGYRPGLGKS